MAKDPELIRQFSIASIKDFSAETIEMIENCDVTSLSLTHLRYRAPWDILLGKFRRGSVIVAGDAMHAMGPFLGQGGSSAIEDAVVLARCLAQKMDKVGRDVEEIGEALDRYVEERRMRLLWLCTYTYLFGSMLEGSSMFVKFLVPLVFAVFFRNPTYHTKYDCGHL